MSSFATSEGGAAPEAPAAPTPPTAPKNKAGGWKFPVWGKTPPKNVKKELRVVLMGIDGSGKTTMLYNMKLGGIMITTIPTVGFNVETMETDNEEFTVWDVGGKSEIRPLWRHYLQNIGVIAFAVDSSPGGRARLPEAKEALHNILQEAGAAAAPLLILATKQEISPAEAMSSEEVSVGLDLASLGAEGRKCIVQLCSSGGGLKEGLFQTLAATAIGTKE